MIAARCKLADAHRLLSFEFTALSSPHRCHLAAQLAISAAEEMENMDEFEAATEPRLLAALQHENLNMHDEAGHQFRAAGFNYAKAGNYAATFVTYLRASTAYMRGGNVEKAAKMAHVIATVAAIEHISDDMRVYAMEAERLERLAVPVNLTRINCARTQLATLLFELGWEKEYAVELSTPRAV